MLVAGANKPENGNRLNLKGSQLACSQHSHWVILIKDRESAQVLWTSHNLLKSPNNKNIHHEVQFIGKMKIQHFSSGSERMWLLRGEINECLSGTRQFELTNYSIQQ